MIYNDKSKGKTISSNLMMCECGHSLRNHEYDMEGACYARSDEGFIIVKYFNTNNGNKSIFCYCMTFKEKDQFESMIEDLDND